MAWYDVNWLYRKKITVDSSKVSSNQTDFPVLIKITGDSDLSKALSSGYDFLITSSDEITKLSHERAHWDNVANDLVLWFKAPSLSSTVNTDFYLYYGNSGASEQASPTGVYRSEYKGVWHLNESSGTRYDSTSNNNDLSEVNTVTQTTGKIHKSAEFTRANSEYLKITDASQTGLDITGNVSYSFWINFKTLQSVLGAGMAIMSKDATGQRGPLLYNAGQINADDLSYYYFSNNSTYTVSSAGNPMFSADDTWYHIALTINRSTQTYNWYRNTSSVTGNRWNSGATSQQNNTADFLLGATNGGVELLDGLIEEFRIYSGIFPTGWLTTEYNNQNSPSTFYSIAAEENNGGGSNYTKDLAETLSITGSMERTISRSLQEVANLTGSIGKNTSRTFDENTSLSDALNKNTQREIAETLTTNDLLVKKPGRNLNEDIVLNDSITLFRGLQTSLQETIVLVDNLVKTFSRSLAENIALTSSLLKTTERNLTEVITLVAIYITGNSYVTSLVESIALTASVSKSAMKNLTERIRLDSISWYQQVKQALGWTDATPSDTMDWEEKNQG